MAAGLKIFNSWTTSSGINALSAAAQKVTEADRRQTATLPRVYGSVKTGVLRFIYQHHLSGRLAVLAAPKKAVILDFTDQPVSRFGGGAPPHAELAELFRQGIGTYRQLLRDVVATARSGLQAIAREPVAEAEPTLQNELFSGLDAAALYGVLRLFNPGTYLEIGSGNSTKFARRAINDGGLRTKIISIDPAPRVEIDTLCDELIRRPLEDIDLHGIVLKTLKAGDVLFIDGSHRCFTNSDVTIFFLEILPRLAPGVIVHIHDILLPFDYPVVWHRKYYSEQYLLACWLLGGSRRLEVLLPCAFASADAELRAMTEPLWDTPEMQRVLKHALQMYHGHLGFSFWLRVTG